MNAVLTAAAFLVGMIVAALLAVNYPSLRTPPWANQPGYEQPAPRQQHPAIYYQ